MSSVRDKIQLSLKGDSSDAMLRKWATYIITHKTPIVDLLDLIHADKPVPIRFSWLLGGICELQPSVVYPSVTYFFSKRHDIQIVNFNRSLAKMFWLAGVPPEIEGEAIDEMFKWLLDPKTIVTTKTYALFALYKLTDKYPDLKNELKLVIEDQLDKNTPPFRKRALKILQDLTSNRDSEYEPLLSSPSLNLIFHMNLQQQIKEYIASQPEPKRSEMQELHRIILQVMSGCKLWFLDGKNSENKTVSNPNIGYGSHTIKYADGTTREFYQIGLSANKTGISVYILGINDKTYLAQTYGKKLGKASVTGYCIKFKTLKNINIDILEAAIRDGSETQNEKSKLM